MSGSFLGENGRVGGETLKGLTQNPKGSDPGVGRVLGETLKGLTRESGGFWAKPLRG